MSLQTAESELKITRVFDAPRELVFKTWTDPSTPGAREREHFKAKRFG